ncbi:triphosphoribosyl-dephospho-CoA synthase [Streptomyces sp. F63]|uniref:triphosphoribosyl-dephospho-CoA synthase n=1 Tax=Streptomyces sp. F63 TaxID=2824887 RepID=UPI001B371C28|nr:triphosphoribosyl-dephospho-CoA synthase [Streptomyces sp. F63]MBQ0986652.1 triphosphoribosyl-dephospho-CoA synthase [Streptomyces sp. F63]
MVLSTAGAAAGGSGRRGRFVDARDARLAEVAIRAVVAAVDLTPKPNLTDTRDPDPGARGFDVRDLGSRAVDSRAARPRAASARIPAARAPASAARHATPDPGALRWAAGALAPGLTAMAAAARRTGEPSPELRAELGAIGRSTEWTVRRAACGTRVHRGAVWVLGLLVAASALEPGAAPGELGAVVKRLAVHRDRGAPLRPSRGSAVSVRYGAAGARGEARAGLPHVRRALDALRTTRNAGADETSARLDALLTVMSTLQDTTVLYEAGPHGLRRVQSGARAVLDAGGAAAEAGRAALAAFDVDLREQALSPAGSVPLLAGALYAEQAVRTAASAPAGPVSGPAAGVRARPRGAGLRAHP